MGLLLLPSCRRQPSKAAPQRSKTPLSTAQLSYSLAFQPMVSGHRGARYHKDYPENCLETFQYLASKEYLVIECDVSMSKDGQLYLMHDNSLDRTTTGTGKVADKDWAYISSLQLLTANGEPTDFRVPLLSDVLNWASGKAILSLDVKRGVPYEKVLKMVQQYKATPYVIIITYNISAAKEVHKFNPAVLISVTARNDKELDRLLDSGIATDKMIAFTGTVRSPESLYKRLHELNILSIFGTFGNIDRQAESRGARIYHELLNSGVDIIATDYPLRVIAAIRQYKKK